MGRPCFPACRYRNDMSGAACRNPKLAQAGAKKHGIIPKPGTFSGKQRQAFQQLQNSRSMGRRHGCGMHDRRGKAFEKGGKPLGEQQERTEQPKRFAECSQDDVRRTRHPGAQPAPSGAERAHRMGLIHHQEKTILAAEFSHTDTSSSVPSILNKDSVITSGCTVAGGAETSRRSKCP